MKKKKTPKGRTGRKELRFDYARVRVLASQGLTQHQVALCLGCSLRTIANRLDEDALFADAYKKGEAEGILQVSNALFQKAVDPLNRNPADRIFFLKTRAKWTERIELTGPNGQPLNSALTPEQQIEQARSMLEEAESADKPAKG